MASPATGTNVEQIAQEMLDLATRVFLATPRGRRRGDELKELEFLTLALLQERGTLIVGEIQRLLGVLPAQMSRIIRGLEEHASAPLISCRINTRDKRKIDVCLTDAGVKALLDYQATRVQRLAELLRDLQDEEQEEVARFLEKLRALLEPRLNA